MPLLKRENIQTYRLILEHVQARMYNNYNWHHRSRNVLPNFCAANYIVYCLTFLDPTPNDPFFLKKSYT